MKKRILLFLLIACFILSLLTVACQNTFTAWDPPYNQAPTPTDSENKVDESYGSENKDDESYGSENKDNESYDSENKYDESSDSENKADWFDTVKVSLGESFSVDLNGDGKPETVKVINTYDDYENEALLILDSDGNELYNSDTVLTDCLCFNSHAYIVDLDNSDNMLSVLFSYDAASADYTGRVIRITGDNEAEPVKFKINGEVLNENYSYPSKIENGVFYFNVRSDILGTRDLYVTASYNKQSGLIEFSDKFYFDGGNENTDLEFTLNFAIKAKDSSGKEVELDAGTVIIPVYTDRKSCLVIRCKDDSMLYTADFFVPDHEYGHYISGIEQCELFDDLRFAG